MHDTNLEVLVLVKEGKPENREKNQQQTHETASPKMEPRSQRWEASAYPLCQPSSELYKKDGRLGLQRNCVLRRWEIETLKWIINLPYWPRGLFTG